MDDPMNSSSPESHAPTSEGVSTTPSDSGISKSRLKHGLMQHAMKKMTLAEIDNPEAGYTDEQKAALRRLALNPRKARRAFARQVAKQEARDIKYREWQMAHAQELAQKIEGNAVVENTDSRG